VACTLLAGMGPIIEELPDDYIKPTTAATSRRQDQFCGGAASGGQLPSQASAGGLRRGFFNRNPSKPERPPVVASTSNPTTSSLSPCISPPATEQHAELSGAKIQEGLVPGEPTSNSEEEDTQGLAEIFGELRRRLHSVAESVASAQKRSASAAAVTDQQRVANLLEPLRAQASSWPTPHAKSSRSKAQAEIGVALAEMRAASNDARRMRSGEERRLLAELRRAVEDAVDRVKKIAEAASPHSASEKDHRAHVEAGFHALPFTAKLRAIADDRAALALLGASFLAGMVVMSGFLLELYTTWGCGMRCTGRWAGNS